MSVNGRMENNYYLATTGISEVWDIKRKMLMLGPWCFVDDKNKKLFSGRDYAVVPSPWRPALKIKEAGEYSYSIYERIMPVLSEKMNRLHGLDYPNSYWKILLGPFILLFIGAFYERYRRIEQALELFPDFITSALPAEECILKSFDTLDFLGCKLNEDSYNLELFSLIAQRLCPRNTVLVHNLRREERIFRLSHNWKGMMFRRLTNYLNSFYNSSVILSEMSHLTLSDKIMLRYKGGIKVNDHLYFNLSSKSLPSSQYSREMREQINLDGDTDKFKSLLFEVLPRAIPACYIENYSLYKRRFASLKKNNTPIKIVGSTVGWYFNEAFKFFAARCTLDNARFMDFQYGGCYGIVLSLPQEMLSLEKDLFYTWGWNNSGSVKTKPLPSPHLSRLADKHKQEIDNLLFVGATFPKYSYILQTELLPDDMQEYFENKGIFLQGLDESIRDKVLYRPYRYEFGWQEKSYIRGISPGIKFVENGKLVEWIKKVKLVVIDHPHTSFLEALVINTPCVFYWNHQAYPIRPEAERYFKVLRDTGIVYEDPKAAAQKVNNIYPYPLKWWMTKEVQDARMNFCRNFAYNRKDWLDIWIKELKQYR